MTDPHPFDSFDVNDAIDGIGAALGIEVQKNQDGMSREHHQAIEKRAKQAISESGVSQEMFDLLVDYCASATTAFELAEVKWESLARKLGTKGELLKEAAEFVNQDGALWLKVLAERIKRARAAKVFRDASWERLESLALGRLTALIERNAIRDPGELLAVATAARRANDGIQKPGAGTTVNVNIGGDPMDDSGLPPAGSTVKIDLSPRVAGELVNRRQPLHGHGRVIDGEMISAKDLRSELERRNKEAEMESTDTVVTEPNIEGDVL